MRNAFIAARTSLLMLVTVSCSDTRPSAPIVDDQAVPPPAGVVVSNPLITSFAANRTSARSSPVAYIAASPGTYGDALTIVITNTTRNSQPVTVPVVNGGFDPVAVEADVNDELKLTVGSASGTTVATIRVPPRRPPSIVRTSPSKGRTDVALDVQIELVFSEPINTTTVNSSSVILIGHGVTLPGRIDVSDNGLYVTFTPQSVLEPGVIYQLSIASSILDHDGEPLGSAEVIVFSTTSASSAVPGNGRLAFLSDRGGNTDIYSSNPNGSDLVRLTTSPERERDIAWSPDGTRIAFVREPLTIWDGRGDIYVMFANGTGVVQLTTTGGATHPAWSPDGREIAYDYSQSQSAFETNSDIAIVDVEKGEDTRRLLGLSSMSAAEPVWLPDGKRIAFLGGKGYYDFWHNVLTIKPDGTDLQEFIKGGNETLFADLHFTADGKKLLATYCTGNDALVGCVLSAGIVAAEYPGDRFTRLMERQGTAYWPNWYAAIHPASSPDGTRVTFNAWQCTGCQTALAYATSDGVYRGYLIDKAWDAEWQLQK